MWTTIQGEKNLVSALRSLSMQEGADKDAKATTGHLVISDAIPLPQWVH